MGDLAQVMVGQLEPLPSRRPGNTGTTARTEFPELLGDLVRRGQLSYTRTSFAGGSTVYRGQHPDESIYLVLAGRVKTIVHSRSGKMCLLRIYGAGEVVGELALLDGARTETAVAMDPVDMLRFSAESLFRALDGRVLHRHLIQHLAGRLAEQQTSISHLVTDDSEQRLGVTLLDLADRLGRPGPAGVTIHDRITQEELAHIVGTTRSRIGYFLRRFEEAGAVEFRTGRVLRVRPAALRFYLDARADAG
ncbi:MULTISPECIES: Crp/Fnr family transcriptional regulator [unclassified Pseudonocardia]|uniref:Crp/Fnr family transcriptional regulator n=1 Tax=unclassified Pseudonocardia TaxID=2619320 RepID=UPI001CF61F1A|nr:Crp/Fnr family transcriptional regulator [Pseudonocardia sp. ICBG601]